MRISQPPVTDVVRASLFTTLGDIAVRGALGVERLAIGAINRVFTVNAAGTGFEYDHGLRVMTTHGDLVVQGAVNPERLPIGADFKILRAQGAGYPPVWIVNQNFHDINNVRWQTKILDIGDWNMDTTASKSIIHNLTAANIRACNAIIRNDAGTTHNKIERVNVATLALQGGVSAISSTAVVLHRLTGGAFDDSNHNAVPYNRGWIFIEYTP